MSAAEALRPDAPAVWQRQRIPYPVPPLNPPRDHVCKACVRNGVRRLWLCLGCGRRSCEHGMRMQRVNGAGYCRRCSWARTRAFNEAFGLGAGQPVAGESLDGEVSGDL